ncbi:MAG TPA: hypothetical protein VH253_18215 [Phycisphaerae bacterium]|nr:hypothetical protein [Phycisphaerae bacterium]
MTVSELRRLVKKQIDHLSEERLRSAADFVSYLEDSIDPVAVAMQRRIRAAEDEVARGAVVSVRHLRRKY